MYKLDLHSHSTYSDGASTIKEIIYTAKHKGLSFLAITDHFTTSWKQNIINSINLNNLEEYIIDIRLEREKVKYNCLIGIEIDMESSLDDIMKLPFEKFEIILFEYVNSMTILKKIVKIINYVDSTAIFGLAHNSYFRTCNLEEFSTILAENDIYFELNSRYLYDTSDEFNRLKKLKENSVKFTIGSDGHDLSSIGETKLSWKVLEFMDGYNNLIDPERLTIFR